MWSTNLKNSVMIQLRSDYLVFEISGGEKIPCSAEQVTIEILSDSLNALKPEVVREAAAAVLHYFKHDLARETVTVNEFTAALARVLRGLGYQVEADPRVSGSSRVAEADLVALAVEAGQTLELDFFPRLRREMRQLLEASPRLVCFRGLRRCAKRFAGASRWCDRSRRVGDEIVHFLRACWHAERVSSDCALMVD
jgi:hypothetical protein